MFPAIIWYLIAKEKVGDEQKKMKIGKLAQQNRKYEKKKKGKENKIW